MISSTYLGTESKLSSSDPTGAFDDEHGRCVIIAASEHDVELAIAALPEAERTRAAALSGPRRREMLAGRAALRTVLADVAGAAAAGEAIVADDRGAPILPAGWTGSISHKGARAAAIVTRDVGARIGVDLEVAAPPRLDIGSRVLTARERAALAGLDPLAYGRAVTLRFAIKEAIYKAVDPFVRRYVGFTEVEVDLAPSGHCRVVVLDPVRLPVTVDARWREIDGHWFATARATRRA